MVAGLFMCSPFRSLGPKGGGGEDLAGLNLWSFTARVHITEKPNGCPTATGETSQERKKRYTTVRGVMECCLARNYMTHVPKTFDHHPYIHSGCTAKSLITCTYIDAMYNLPLYMVDNYLKDCGFIESQLRFSPV